MTRKTYKNVRDGKNEERLETKDSEQKDDRSDHAQSFFFFLSMF